MTTVLNSVFGAVMCISKTESLVIGLSTALGVEASNFLVHSEQEGISSVLQPSSIRGLATPWTHFVHLSLSSNSD